MTGVQTCALPICLFGTDALDISTDISVLEAMLAREGLAGEKMEAQTTKNGDGTDLKLEL